MDRKSNSVYGVRNLLMCTSDCSLYMLGSVNRSEYNNGVFK